MTLCSPTQISGTSGIRCVIDGLKINSMSTSSGCVNVRNYKVNNVPFTKNQTDIYKLALRQGQRESLRRRQKRHLEVRHSETTKRIKEMIWNKRYLGISKQTLEMVMFKSLFPSKLTHRSHKMNNPQFDFISTSLKIIDTNHDACLFVRVQ